ncbi:MAG TPA: cyclic nucleotide-binding domain-containing protein [Anaerolineae bacterium]|nr:cyclic nucleotide-binding domain-containing protein [Anaerolineae bacterium]
MSTKLKNQSVVRQQLIEMLRAYPRLRSLSDEQVQELANKAECRLYKANEMVIKAGEQGAAFFFIIDGQARVIKEIEGDLKVVEHFQKGSLFGEQALLNNAPRNATIEVMVDSTLAVFNAETWQWLVKIPGIKEEFANLEKEYKKQAERTLPGIHKDEVVLIMAKRHMLAYIASLTTPLFILLIGLLISGLLSLLEIPFILPAGIALFLALAGAVYNYFEWQNDDFIVTSQRVIHIERVILHGEMREESPLTAIQDISINTHNWLTRLFDYHILTIQTAGVGNILFDGLKNTEEIKNIIFEQRTAAQQRVAASDTTAMRRALAQTMNWPIGPVESTIPLKENEEQAVEKSKFHIMPRLSIRKGDKIIWRKHPWVLLKNVWLQLLVLAGLFYLLIAGLVGFVPFSEQMNGPVFILLVVLIFFSFFWFSYGADDWRKDIYIVTNDRIIDIEGSPFDLGPEQRREGTFGVIQNITYKSPSYFTRVLNMGDVVIETAGTMDTFTFKQVYDYRGVQQEISKRLFAFKEQQRQKERAKGEKRFTQWLGEYHTMSGEVGEIEIKG